MTDLKQTTDSSISLDNTISKLEHEAQNLMDDFLAKNEKLKAFHSGRWIDCGFYTRHMIEAANRIPLLNSADAYALYRCGALKPELGAALARYLAEEWGHEQMIWPDLKQLGVSIEDCQNTPLFRSTESLMTHHYKEAENGLVFSSVFNWFVEWYSDRYNPIITNRAKEEFG